MSKKFNNSTREYNIDSEKLHLFFVSTAKVTDNYDKISELATQLTILSEHFYSQFYNHENVLECTLKTIYDLYIETQKELELINNCRQIYSELCI